MRTPSSRTRPDTRVSAPLVLPHRVQLIVILGALSAFGPLSLDMYLPALPALAADLGASAAEAQLTLTACLLGLACGQIVAGPLSDALGRRRPLLAGLVGYTLASLICAAAPSVPVLVLLRLLQGVAGAAGIVIARAAVRDLFSGADVARFFSLTMLVNGLAPILAPVIGGQVLRLTSWRGVFVVLTVVGLLLVLSALLGLPETLPSGRRRSGGLRATLHTYRRLLADPALMRYSLASGLAMAAMFAYIAGSPFVIENLYGVSPQRFSLIFGANAFGIVVLSQVGARLVTRAGAGRLLAAGLGVSLLGSLLLLASVTLGAGLAGILPAFFLIVASIGLIGPNATALALADHPQTAGSASALIGVMQYIFGAVVAPLVGLGGMATAMPLAVVIVSLSVLANAIFVIGRGHD